MQAMPWPFAAMVACKQAPTAEKKKAPAEADAFESIRAGRAEQGLSGSDTALAAAFAAAAGAFAPEAAATTAATAATTTARISCPVAAFAAALIAATLAAAIAAAPVTTLAAFALKLAVGAGRRGGLLG